MITWQFCKGPDLSSEAIEWFEHGGFSHVDTVMPDGTLLGARSDVIGGMPAGVQIRPADYLGSEYVYRVTLPTTPEQDIDYYEFLKQQLGKPYDKEGIVGFIVGREWRDDSAWFCSELAMAALEQSAFLKWPLADHANKITPGDALLIASVFTRVDL